MTPLEIKRNKMVVDNMELVPRVAKRYLYVVNVPYEDLLQYGYMGLMRAAEKYDETKGQHFSTYAFWWIRAKIMRGILQHKKVAAKAYVMEATTNLNKYVSTYYTEHGTYPTKEIIFDNVRVDPDDSKNRNKIKLALDYNAIQVKRFVPTREVDTSSSYMEIPEDSFDPQVEDQYDKVSRKEVVKKGWAKLTKLEQFVLQKRYIEEVTLEKTAELWMESKDADKALSRERIRQIEVKALSKMRKAI